MLNYFGVLKPPASGMPRRTDRSLALYTTSRELHRHVLFNVAHLLTLSAPTTTTTAEISAGKRMGVRHFAQVSGDGPMFLKRNWGSSDALHAACPFELWSQEFQLKLPLVLVVCTSSLKCIQTLCGHLVLDYVVELHTASWWSERFRCPWLIMPCLYTYIFF